MSLSAPPPPVVVPPSNLPRRRRGSVVGPLVLIFLGCIVLLQNTGYLPPDTWFNLWRLWPLLLVLAGIELLFAQHVRRLALALLIAVVLVVGFVATTYNGLLPGLWPTPSAAAPTSTARTDLGGASQAAVTVRYGAGHLAAGPLVQPDPGELALMTFTGPSDAAPQPRFTTSDGSGHLDYQLNGRAGPAFLPFIGSSDGTRLDLDLNPNVPITLLTIQVGATDTNLDLSNLQVKGLEMSVGATSAQIHFPQAAGKTTAHISSGVSTLTLDIPQNVAAQIHHRGGLSTINVEARFPSVGGGTYRSPDYASAPNTLDLNLESGLTTIQVR